LDVVAFENILSIMKEFFLQAFGTADASVIFYLGAFLSLLGALLARQMYRAQSVPVFAGITATLMLAAGFIIVCIADVLAPPARDRHLTVFFLATFSVFWLIVVISTSPSTAPPPPLTRKRFRAWMAGLALGVIVLLAQIVVNDLAPAAFRLGDIVMQILLGTVCGIFFVGMAISAFRLWRSHDIIWAWLTLALLVNASAALIVYQPSLFIDAGLLVYACLAACPLLVKICTT
jgi:hypothetical protein